MVVAYLRPLVAGRGAAVATAHLLPDAEKLIDIAVRTGFTLLVALVVQRLLFLAAGRLERLIARHGHESRHSIQRARTVGQIVRNLITVVVGVFALIHILEVVGWDVKPLVAGAGIIGVALGFGAQSLVRDVIAGVFILVENQYSVGDLIEINGKAATVEALTVRSTVLRDFNGYLHFVPNGEMKVVTNRSRDWNRLTVDIGLPTGVDLDRALAVCRAEVQAFNADAQWSGRLLEPVELWGVESVTSQEATLRSAFRARPGSGAPEVARELRRRLYRALAQARIRTHPVLEPGVAPAAPGVAVAPDPVEPAAT